MNFIRNRRFIQQCFSGKSHNDNNNINHKNEPQLQNEIIENKVTDDHHELVDDVSPYSPSNSIHKENYDRFNELVATLSDETTDCKHSPNNKVALNTSISEYTHTYIRKQTKRPLKPNHYSNPIQKSYKTAPLSKQDSNTNIDCEPSSITMAIDSEYKIMDEYDENDIDTPIPAEISVTSPSMNYDRIEYNINKCGKQLLSLNDTSAQSNPVMFKQNTHSLLINNKPLPPLMLNNKSAPNRIKFKPKRNSMDMKLALTNNKSLLNQGITSIKNMLKFRNNNDARNNENNNYSSNDNKLNQQSIPDLNLIMIQSFNMLAKNGFCSPQNFTISQNPINLNSKLVNVHQRRSQQQMTASVLLKPPLPFLNQNSV